LTSADPGPDEAAALLPELTLLAAQASAAIRRCAAAPPRRKADGSPVTEADEAAEAVILEGLDRLLPGVPVIAEERLGREGAPRLDGTFVLVDPLDGTKEFIAGRADYTVNIALIARAAPVCGVVAAPAQDLLWRGVIGRGAERVVLGNRGVGPSEPIRVRHWPSSGAVALVSRSHRDSATEALLRKLPPATAQSCGSSLKFCRVAEGSADVYPRLGPTSEWDIAAGHAVLAAAGGLVTAPDGRPLAYGRVQERFVVPGFIAWGDRQKAQTI
jgi:3'(2'), 5'-bisphosphate nucleotidase